MLLFSFHVVVVHVLLFVEGSCITPLYSFLQELGNIKNQQLAFFYNKFFFLFLV